jgi:uncharacterized membrane protein YgdD (TMEM256/DUF423 family)
MTTGMLSAYGFHGLAETLTEADRLSWRWAVQIQAYASISLLIVTIFDLLIGPTKLLNIARSLFILAIVVFSGTVYLEKLGLIPQALGNIAPLGGSSFMLAWGLVAVAVLLKK